MKLLTWAGVGLFLCLNGFADEKARLIDVSHYKIRWEIDPAKNPDHFTGQVTVTLQTKVATNRISLDAEELEIEKVVAEKPKGSVSFTLKKNELLIDFPKALPKNATAQFTVYYKGKVRTDHTGLSKVFDPDEPERGPIFFTQFESQDARKFFPCNDDPSDKATTEVVTFLPERYEALSNGERGKDRYLKVGGERWREIPWALNEPHSTYLVAVAVGPFGSLSLPFGKKEAAVWVAKTKLDKARFTSTVTKDLIGYYEKLLAIPYPWKKYFTVGIPTFLWGGMENTSITFMNEERILLNDPRSEFEKKRIVSLVAHELAHQWFGDYVTLKGWEDLWLNESFASYFGTRATENYFKTEEEHLDVTLNTWDSYFREEDGPRSHPIVNVGAPNPDDAFDSTSYTKGENVLRMLHFYLGENAFTKGITGYLKKHAYSNATYKDFFKSMEVASGQNLTAFSDSWLLNRGYPILTYGGTWDSKANTFTFHLQQNPNHAEDGTLFHFKIPVVFHRTSSPAYGKALVVLMDKKEFQEKVVLPAEPEWISINPKAEVLAKVRQETEDEKSLSSQALFDPDLTARVWALTELSSDLNEGKTISSASERTLIQSLKTDPSPYVRMAVLQNILRMKSRWLPDALGAAIFGIAKSKVTQDHDLASSDSDTHGWTEWK